MNVILISTAFGELCLGLRIISAVLKEKGYSVRKIFLPCPNLSAIEPYDKRTMDDLADLCREANLIGFSLMSLDLKVTDFTASALKKRLPSKTIIYGGMHTILCPETCLNWADIVCVSEGENAIVELTNVIENSGDITRVRGFWFKQKDNIIRQKAAPLVQNLDNYPFPDFSFEDTYLFYDGRIQPLNSYLMKDSFNRFYGKEYKNQPTFTYGFQASRGCPYHCTYCSNTQYLDVFKGTGKPYRTRRPENVIEELKTIRKQYPYINFIDFYDDDFLMRPQADLETLMEHYREEVGLPFVCSTSPQSVSSQRLETLINSGVLQIRIGIQSGSQRILKDIYKRPADRSAVLKALEIITPFTRRVLIRYDFIFDNPYEDLNDFIETLEVVQYIPKPYRLQCFSLVVFPETELYAMLKRDGLLNEKSMGDKKIFPLIHHLEGNTYYKFLVFVSPFINKTLFRIMRNGLIFNLLNRPFFDRIFSFIYHSGLKIATHLKSTRTWT